MCVGRGVTAFNEKKKKDYHIWSEWREKGHSSSGARWLRARIQSRAAGTMFLSLQVALPNEEINPLGSYKQNKQKPRTLSMAKTKKTGIVQLCLRDLYFLENSKYLGTSQIPHACWEGFKCIRFAQKHM